MKKNECAGNQALASMAAGTRSRRVRDESSEGCNVKGTGKNTDKRALRWSGHMERMNGQHMRVVIGSTERRGRLLGRPRFEWMDGEKVALNEDEITGSSMSVCRGLNGEQ